jgi:type II secretory pathway pseudopilin PulG
VNPRLKGPLTHRCVPWFQFKRHRAFTLLELLVLVVVISLLAALLLPAMGSVKQKARRAACISNLRQIGIAIHAYADDSGGRIPYGPAAPPFTSPASFYPTTGSPTSLLSLRDGSPVALGLLLDNHLASASKTLFCPGRDQPLDAEAELAKVGHHQAQGSYFYRHAGVTTLFQAASVNPPNLRLDNLGTNRLGDSIRALVIDMNILTPPGLESFNVITRTQHRAEMVQVLHADGSVATRRNQDQRFTVNTASLEDLRNTFDRILTVFERADAAR